MTRQPPTTPQRIVPKTVIHLESDSSHRDATSLDHLPQGKEEGRSAIRTDSEGGIPAPSPSSEAAAIPASPRAAGPVQTSGPKADNRFGEAFKAATKRVDKYMVDHNYDQFLTTIQNEPAPSRPLSQDPRMKEIHELNKEFCAGLWTEVAQIREDACGQLSDEEVEMLYSSVINYTTHHYTGKLANALSEYLNRRP